MNHSCVLLDKSENILLSHIFLAVDQLIKKLKANQPIARFVVLLNAMQMPQLLSHFLLLYFIVG